VEEAGIKIITPIEMPIEVMNLLGTRNEHIRMHHQVSGNPCRA
jgi:hypothetical protein